MYDANTDKYCPQSVVRKYNLSKSPIEQGSIADSIHGGIAPGEMNMSVITEDSNFRTKLPESALESYYLSASAQTYDQETVDIRTRIVSREKLLSELRRLVESLDESPSSYNQSINEIVEVVKAFRHQTLDIIEHIQHWQKIQINYPKLIMPFLHDGINYATKIMSDLDFLDKYDVIIAKFCFEFTGNPLAYRYGGDLLHSASLEFKLFTAETADGGISESTILNDGDGGDKRNTYDAVDGIEIWRLRNAEVFVKDEIARGDMSHLHGFASMESIHNSMKIASSSESQEDIAIEGLL